MTEQAPQQEQAPYAKRRGKVSKTSLLDDDDDEEDDNQHSSIRLPQSYGYDQELPSFMVGQFPRIRRLGENGKMEDVPSDASERSARRTARVKKQHHRTSSSAESDENHTSDDHDCENEEELIKDEKDRAKKSSESSKKHKKKKKHSSPPSSPSKHKKKSAHKDKHKKALVTDGNSSEEDEANTTKRAMRSPSKDELNAGRARLAKTNNNDKNNHVHSPPSHSKGPNGASGSQYASPFRRTARPQLRITAGIRRTTRPANDDGPYDDDVEEKIARALRSSPPKSKPRKLHVSAIANASASSLNQRLRSRSADSDEEDDSELYLHNSSRSIEFETNTFAKRESPRRTQSAQSSAVRHGLPSTLPSLSFDSADRHSSRKKSNALLEFDDESHEDILPDYSMLRTKRNSLEREDEHNNLHQQAQQQAQKDQQQQQQELEKPPPNTFSASGEELGRRLPLPKDSWEVLKKIQSEYQPKPTEPIPPFYVRHRISRRFGGQEDHDDDGASTVSSSSSRQSRHIYPGIHTGKPAHKTTQLSEGSTLYTCPSCQRRMICHDGTVVLRCYKCQAVLFPE